MTGQPIYGIERSLRRMMREETAAALYAYFGDRDG